MGPFPHDAPKSVISAENPAGTDGFEFVEFAHPDPQALRDLFSKMGFVHTANHKSKAIELWQQGDITYVINAQPDSHAAQFIDLHGPCAPSMGWRVVDAAHAFDHAVANGAKPYTGEGRLISVSLNFPPPEGELRVWNTETWELLQTRAWERAPRTVDVDPSGTKLLIAYQGGEVEIRSLTE